MTQSVLTPFVPFPNLLGREPRGDGLQVVRRGAGEGLLHRSENSCDR